MRKASYISYGVQLTVIRGGKVAMSAALSPDLPSDLLGRLIVVDIAPARGVLSPEFRGYTEAMKKIEASGASTRQEAQKILVPYEKVQHTFLIRRQSLTLGRMQ